jgi:thymidylate kinase
LAAANPERWLVIDGTQPVAAVAAELDAGLHERFGWTS